MLPHRTGAFAFFTMAAQALTIFADPRLEVRRVLSVFSCLAKDRASAAPMKQIG